MQKSKSVFVFMALVYNHEKYVIEHLESIKFLVEKYGSNVDVDLFISDDFSRDLSRRFIDVWLDKNRLLFRDVKTFFNEKNIGTCKSLANMLRSAPKDMDICKITAADDIYSFENIFEVCNLDYPFSMLQAIPLNFIDKNLYLDKGEFSGICASKIIYEKRKLIERFKFLSVNNAPNIIYNTRLLKSNDTLKFLIEHDVVEDWPIQISIAESSEVNSYVVLPKVYVYYRRTAGSTYIVASKRFFSDKVKIYKYLVSGSDRLVEKIIIRNRCWLFSIRDSRFKKIFNKVLNISFYIFVLKFFMNFKKISSFMQSVKPDVNVHQNHLTLVKKRAKLFFKNEDLDL